MGFQPAEHLPLSIRLLKLSSVNVQSTLELAICRIRMLLQYLVCLTASPLQGCEVYAMHGQSCCRQRHSVEPSGKIPIQLPCLMIWLRYIAEDCTSGDDLGLSAVFAVEKLFKVWHARIRLFAGPE